MEADILLNDFKDGAHYAKRAINIGWCHPKLAKDISFFLMNDQCKLVLPMLYRTIAEGDKPKGCGVWQFNRSGQKERLALIAADGEAHCTDNAKALEKLDKAK